MSKCCGCNKKVLSNAVANNTDSCTCSLTDNCTDVCVTPQCGDPKLLTVLVPVIYDEIGINVCRTIPLATLLADYPTAAYIRAEVTNITFATGAAPSVTIKPIAGRPNCYELTLTNLTVDFVIYVYDCCKRLLATLPVTGVVYLPSATTDKKKLIQRIKTTGKSNRYFLPNAISTKGFKSTNRQIASHRTAVA